MAVFDTQEYKFAICTSAGVCSVQCARLLACSRVSKVKGERRERLERETGCSRLLPSSRLSKSKRERERESRLTRERRVSAGVCSRMLACWRVSKSRGIKARVSLIAFDLKHTRASMPFDFDTRLSLMPFDFDTRRCASYCIKAHGIASRSTSVPRPFERILDRVH